MSRTAPVERPMRVLVVAPVPPPVTGKNVMVQTLLEGRYEHAELIHVNATIASSTTDMGRFSARKLARLALVIARGLAARARQRPAALYYTPAGDDRGGILRDILLLLPLRAGFGSVIYHLHGRGLPTAVDALPGPIRRLAWFVYRRPDVLVGPSQAIVSEAARLVPAETRVVANGTVGGRPAPPSRRAPGDPVRVLFLSRVSEEKGAGWLLEAVAALQRSGTDVRVTLAGPVHPPGYELELRRRAEALGIAGRLDLVGVVTGEAKWESIRSADIFCVPSTYSQESFGLVLVEAASCAVPIVAADVPGVREVLQPNESVLLADPADRSTLFGHLERLSSDPDLARRLGDAARREFEDRYTVEHHWRAMDELFGALARRPAGTPR